MKIKVHILVFLSFISFSLLAQSSYEDAVNAYLNKDYVIACVLLGKFEEDAESFDLPKRADYYLMSATANAKIGIDSEAQKFISKFQEIAAPLIQQYLNEASENSNAKNFDAAISTIDKAISFSVYVFKPEHPKVIEMRENGLKYALIAGNNAKIIEHASVLSGYFKQKNDLINFTRLARPLAKAFEGSGKEDQSKMIYEHFLTNTPNYLSADNPYFLPIIADYGNMLFDKKLYSESVRPFQVLEIGVNAGLFDDATSALIYNNLGLGLEKQEKFEEAVSYYTKAFEIGDRIYDVDGLDMARLHLNIGIAYENLSKYELAAHHLAKAVPVYFAMSDEENFANAYDHYYACQSMVIIEKKKSDQEGDWRVAYKQVFEVESRLKGRFHTFYTFLIKDLENFYSYNEKYTELEKLYEDLLAMHELRSGKQSKGYIVTLVDLAGSYELSGRYEKAEAGFRQALDFSEKMSTGHNAISAYAAGNLATFLKNIGQQDEAKKLYSKAMGIYESLGYDIKDDYYQSHLIGYASTLNPKIQEDKKTFDNVLKELLRIPIDSTTDLGIHMATARLSALMIMEIRMERFVDAKTTGEKALALIKKLKSDNSMGKRRILQNMAYVYLLLREHDKALLMLEELFDLHYDFVNKNRSYLTESELGQLYQHIAGDFNTYNTLIIKQLNKYNKRIDKVLNGSIFFKGLLFDNTRRVMEDAMKSEDEVIRRLLSDLTQKRNELINPQNAYNPIDQLKKEIEQIEKELSARSPSVSESIKNESVKWQEVQKVLNEGEALIEFLRIQPPSFFPDTSATYACFILTPATKTTPTVVLMDDAARMDFEYLRFYRNAILYKLNDTLSYKRYWQPLEKALKGINKVFVSPDGVFNQISIASLFDAESDKYLIEKYEVTLISNPSDIISKNENPISFDGAVLIGDPNYNYDSQSKTNDLRFAGMNLSNVAPLPGTREELMVINEILSGVGIHSEIRHGMEASEKFMQANQTASILHIATHGFFITYNKEKETVPGSPMIFQHPLLQSGLLLSGDEDNDGILTAYEVTNLNLDKTQLVVLSACETGLGEVKNGEGVYGLPRALRSSGADAVIMSLWKVSDGATRDLMISFYSHLMKSRNYSESLKKAQLDMKAKYKDPYYWAAFVLIAG